MEITSRCSPNQQWRIYLLSIMFPLSAVTLLIHWPVHVDENIMVAILNSQWVIFKEIALCFLLLQSTVLVQFLYSTWINIQFTFHLRPILEITQYTLHCITAGFVHEKRLWGEKRKQNWASMQPICNSNLWRGITKRHFNRALLLTLLFRKT